MAVFPGFGLLHGCGAALNLRNVAKSARCRPLSCCPLSVVNRVVHALYTWLCGLLGNVPLLFTSTPCPPTSLHVTSFTRPSPTLVLQATNAGVRRPGNNVGHTLFWAHYIQNDHCWIMNILTRTNHDYEYISTVHVTRNDYSTTV